MKMFLNSNRSFEILCLILGMMQSGLSRELFESWCTDSKNGCIVAGYCVEGMFFQIFQESHLTLLFITLFLCRNVSKTYFE